MLYKKIIKTGDIIEVECYTSLNLNVPTNRNGPTNFGEHTSETKDENYLKTIKSRRDNVRRLVTQNFDVKYSKFVTLTFDGKKEIDITDVIQCDKAFKTFIQRLKYWLIKNGHDEPLKYVAVIEFQKRGAVHYHMICNLPYIKKKDLQDIWQNGFIKINSIEKVDNIGAYVIKYMTKEKADSRLKGLKGYLASNNLTKPLVLKSWSDNKYERQLYAAINLSLATKKEVYSSQYTSSTNEYNIISYKQYNLKRENVQQKRKNQIEMLDYLFGVGGWELVE